MNFLKRFLGLYDKAQAKRTEDVAAYVHEKKSTFTADMVKLQNQARKVHNKTRQAHIESAKLNSMVEDITTKISIATGGANR